jgi:CBS domain-containing protein
MRVAKLLRNKGDFVATVQPDSSVKSALADLARYGVGALIVSSDGRTPEGIVSERDVVRRLNDTGDSILDGPVSAIMSTSLHLCAPGDEIDSLMATMTTHRIRHVPVVEGGLLVGIVSIGDVVKSRMDELEDDRRALVDYINAR